MSVETASVMHMPGLETMRDLEPARDAADHAAAGAPPHRPSNKRARVEAFDDTTQRLFEELQQHVHQCLAARARQDQEQRAVSRRIAAAHPLTFSAACTASAARTRSVSPYMAAASPADDAAASSTAACKDTPCLVPTPVCSTPPTTLKADEHSKAPGVQQLEPPELSI